VIECTLDRQAWELLFGFCAVWFIGIAVAIWLESRG